MPATIVKPKLMTEPGMGTFDVENIFYSQQVMNWQSKFFFGGISSICVRQIKNEVCKILIDTKAGSDQNRTCIISDMLMQPHLISFTFLSNLAPC